MKMKKVVPVVLTLALASSLSVTALAADKTAKETKTKVEISAPRVDPDAEARITSQAAEDIALADAGLTRKDVKGIHSYAADYAWGIPSTYRVEFAVYDAAVRHTTVYTYTINSLTSEIVSSTVR